MLHGLDQPLPPPTIFEMMAGRKPRERTPEEQAAFERKVADEVASILAREYVRKQDG